MNAPELTRKYGQPIPVSTSTALHYRQFKNNTSVTASLGSIPEVTELLKIKADLENLLPISERRIKYLQRDLSTVKKHIEPSENEAPIRKSSGKNISQAMIEKLQVKEEVPEEPLHNNNSQLERQLALETLRKKRRRDDDTKDNGSKKKKIINNTNNQVDFVRVKPKDQIPILTFWSAIDPYFRPLTEDDRNFLLPKEDQEKYYTIPPLGRHYLDVWLEEELPMNHHMKPPQQSVTMMNQPITDHDLIRQDVTCGPITERLLSSLIVQDQDVKEDEEEEEEEEEEEDDDDDIVDNEEEVVADIHQFEERLKRELEYVGLFNEEEDVDWNYKEDDEICTELRATARELREQFTINEERKKRLLSVVDEQLQYEQYRHVLDNLDIQVDQCYLKRFRTQKSKKRKTPTTATASSSKLSENAVYAMNKRKAWIDALDGIFQDKNMIMPTQSIYE